VRRWRQDPVTASAQAQARAPLWAGHGPQETHSLAPWTYLSATLIGFGASALNSSNRAVFAAICRFASITSLIAAAGSNIPAVSASFASTIGAALLHSKESAAIPNSAANFLRIASKRSARVVMRKPPVVWLQLNGAVKSPR